MFKILIVEDDIELREELSIFLTKNGYESYCLEDFQDPLSKMEQRKPDLILLDINLPNCNGEFLLKEMRKQSNVPVIMLTSRNTEVDEVLSMTYGADDYITKPYNPTLLLLRIEAVLKRYHHVSHILTYQDVTINVEKGTVLREKQELILSKNEMRILVYLVNHQGAIVTRDELMNHLWDNMEFVDDNTLTVNINRLRGKLSEIGLYHVIETRRGLGYILL